MANLGQTFSADNLPQPERNYDLIPAGWYNVKITDAELNNTKAGTGQKIDLRYDILGPTQQGRVMFGTVNIVNQNPEAQRIGHEQLGEIMRSIGLHAVEDTDQLIGGELQIKVRIKDPSERDKAAGYTEQRNDIAGYKALANRTSSMPQASQQQPSAPAGAAPPWAKK